MDCITLLLCMKLELKSDQLIDISRILSVWHLIKCDAVQKKFLMHSGHGSHKPKNHSQKIHLLLSMTENSDTPDSSDHQEESDTIEHSVWKGCLRSHRNLREDTYYNDGDV